MEWALLMHFRMRGECIRSPKKKIPERTFFRRIDLEREKLNHSCLFFMPNLLNIDISHFRSKVIARLQETHWDIAVFGIFSLFSSRFLDPVKD
jgi:hypothetical protein